MRELFAAKLAVSGAVIVLLSGLLVSTACQETTISAKDREAADTAGARAHEAEKQAAENARKALNLRLDEAQHRLDALKTEAKPATAQARRDLDEQTKGLQGQVKELRDKLQSQQGRNEEWSKVKADFDDAVKKINDKIDDLTHSHK